MLRDASTGDQVTVTNYFLNDGVTPNSLEQIKFLADGTVWDVSTVKQKALSGLAQAPCTGAGVCEVRDACQGAYALHVEGVTLTEAAKQRLHDGRTAEAAALLGPAEEKLKEAGRQVEACTERAAALQRRYRL